MPKAPFKPERYALLTAAAGMLGARMAERLTRDGWRVIGTSRRKPALDALAASLGRRAGFVPVVADLADGGGADLIGRLARRGIQPALVVNNAFDMSNQKLGTSGMPTRRQWKIEFDYAVVAPYEIVMAAAATTGSTLEVVVNVASMYGVVPRNPSLYDDPVRQSPIHYGVAKAAMIHLTRELAVRLAPRGVRVNAVSYGGVEGRVDDAFKARYARLSPMGRMLKPEEVPGIVAMLASRDASAITGQNVVVDAGFTVW
jgi:hypothetical protein